MDGRISGQIEVSRYNQAAVLIARSGNRSNFGRMVAHVKSQQAFCQARRVDRHTGSR